jgi:hypothetical protein
MRKKWRWIASACLMSLYLVLWYFLLAYLFVPKFYALLWIGSSLFIIPLTILKKQTISLSLVCAFLFGPLALLIIAFVPPDIRYFNEGEKNEVFYQKLIQKIDLKYNQVFPSEGNFTGRMPGHEFQQLADYFKIKLHLKYEGRYSGGYHMEYSEYVEIFREVYERFAREYADKFAKEFPGINERFADIEIWRKDQVEKVKEKYKNIS